MTHSAYQIGSLVLPLVESPTHLSPDELGITIPQVWSVLHPIGGLGAGASIYTFIKNKSPEFPLQIGYASLATRNSLRTIFDARAIITFKSPWDTTGFNVLMLECLIRVMQGYVPPSITFGSEELYEIDMRFARR